MKNRRKRLKYKADFRQTGVIVTSFGFKAVRCPESKTKKSMKITISATLRNKVFDYSIEKGISLSRAATELIEMGFEKLKGKE